MKDCYCYIISFIFLVGTSFSLFLLDSKSLEYFSITLKHNPIFTYTILLLIVILLCWFVSFMILHCRNIFEKNNCGTENRIILDNPCTSGSAMAQQNRREKELFVNVDLESLPPPPYSECVNSEKLSNYLNNSERFLETPPPSFYHVQNPSKLP